MKENFENRLPRQIIEHADIKELTDKVLDMSPRRLAVFVSDFSKDDELKDFLGKAAGSDALLAMISYYQRWLTPRQSKLFDKIVAERREADIENDNSLPLGLEKKFTPYDLALILSNLQAIQLTFGCSGGCPLCAVDALPGVRENIPYYKLENLFRQYGGSIGESKPVLYFSSEPSDYKDLFKKKNYKDVHLLAEEFAHYSPGISSREVKDKDWLEFLKDKNGAQVSVFGKNDKEINKIKFRAESVRLVGQGKRHREGIGRSNTPNTEGDKGIGCGHGALLTPRGLYNVVQIPISEEFPQGQIVMPIEKISEGPIKQGDSLKDVLRGCVVKSKITVSQLNFFNRQNNEWRTVDIIRKDGGYRIKFDKKGFIEQVEKEIKKEE